MESWIGRVMSTNEKAVALSVIVGIIAAYATRAFMQDYIEDN